MKMNEKKENKEIPEDGQPCEHPGCLNHLTHQCEGCGRIGASYLRPKICFDPKCRPLEVSTNLHDWHPGKSFDCWGAIDPHRFTGDGHEHNNDISHCIYTPAKGIVRFFENLGDQQLQLRSLATLLCKLGEDKINLTWIFREPYSRIEGHTAHFNNDRLGERSSAENHSPIDD
jgi:hypothetical protein